VRPVLFAVGWVFLMLAVILAASGIAHDAAYIFARRRMTRARVLRISLFGLLALIFIIISFQV
jgi:heme/copper-type cytochrome/quinol oxidase subunit 3